MHIVEHDVDAYIHNEFASADVSHEVDAHHDVVTHDVTRIPGIFLHDDLSVIQGHDVDFLFSDDHSNDDLVLEVLALSSAY